MQQRSDHDLLIEIHTNLDNFMSKFNDHVTNDNTKFDHHDKRIGTLEQGWWKACGALSVFIVFIELTMRILGK